MIRGPADRLSKNGHFMIIGQKFGTSSQKKKNQNILKNK